MQVGWNLFVSCLEDSHPFTPAVSNLEVGTKIIHHKRFLTPPLDIKTTENLVQSPKIACTTYKVKVSIMMPTFSMFGPREIALT